jgi:hypothetical protein
VTPVDERRSSLIIALVFALCLVAGSAPRIVGDGGEYLAQALNFAAFNPPSLGRQTIPAIHQRITEIAPGLADWDIAATGIPGGADRRRDFVHFWLYALLATPFVLAADVVGISPLHGFTALNLILLALALRLALRQLDAPVVVLLFASPLVWWIDKAHTEVFTVSLLTIAMLTLRDRPWWALVAAGMAGAQNPPITIVVVLILSVEVARRRSSVFADRRLVAGVVAAVALAALQPAYTYLRHGTPSLLVDTVQAGLPTWTEIGAAVLDPSMGLVGNYPVFVIATSVAAAWVVARSPRALIAPATFVAAGASVVFLYAFAQPANLHHGGTPGLTRYALWLIPLSLAIWVPVHELAGVRARRIVAAAAGLSAFVSVIAFHPGVDEKSREPTWLASWLWTERPAWNNPLPEVFAETLTHEEGTTLPVATPGCEKILLTGDVEGSPQWPIPCLPAPVPPQCQSSGVLCYANRDADAYTFALAPGRPPLMRRAAVDTWPHSAEPHVRRTYLDAQWARMTEDPNRLEALRSYHNVRVGSFGDNNAFLLVLRPAGRDAALHFRSAAPLRGTMIDASTGDVLARLALDGSSEEIQVVPVPSGRDGLVLLTMTRGDHPE